VLTADIEFLHTVLGLQSCSAMYPCFICLIKLDQLRKERSTSNGEDRTPEIFAAHLAEVLGYATSSTFDFRYRKKTLG